MTLREKGKCDRRVETEGRCGRPSRSTSFHSLVSKGGGSSSHSSFRRGGDVFFVTHCGSLRPAASADKKEQMEPEHPPWELT